MPQGVLTKCYGTVHIALAAAAAAAAAASSWAVAAARPWLGVCALAAAAAVAAAGHHKALPSWESAVAVDKLALAEGSLLEQGEQLLG